MAVNTSCSSMGAFISLERPCYHNECGHQRCMLVTAVVDDGGDDVVVEPLRAPMSTTSNGLHGHRRQVLRCCGCESRESQHWSGTRLSMSLKRERSRFCGPFLVL